MYRRPNATFKPPRPLEAQAEVKKNAEVKESDGSDPSDNLFVPEESNKDDSQLRKRAKVASLTKFQVPARAPNFNRVSNSQIPTKSEDLTSSDNAENQEGSQTSKSFYSVQWRKRSTKKNKSWEGDGYIIVGGTSIILKVEQSKGFKVAGRTSKMNLDGVILLGMYEAEVDCQLTREEVENLRGEALLSPVKKEKENIGPAAQKATPSLGQMRRAPGPAKIKADAKSATADANTRSLSLPEENLSEDAFVLPSGPISNSKPVVVDPCLTRVLRPHQREGISFMYECVMGMKSADYNGALLADEMGLGKTLMTISLIWTLLKQSPFPEQSGVIKKVLICCPVSIIDNWRKEFRKWIDINRVGILTVNNKQQTAAKDKQDIVNFGKTHVYQVLIMSYEKVLSCSESLSNVDIDFLVCDEGHRLKSASNKVLKVLTDLEVPKKLVLTGTPIQNDLNEFYNIVNFINPGILGTSLEFQRKYLKPILRARDVNCTSKEVMEEGREISAMLIELTKSFTLRRTKSIINKYLPSKTDIIIFCPPTKLQNQLFDMVINSSQFNSIMNADTRDVLSMILVLRKICNSPSLVASDLLFETLHSESGRSLPSLSNRTTGSKVNVLVPLLLEFQKVNEKVVLVSNYTQSLDFLELVLLKLNIQYSRLDGSTPSKLRDKLVVDFNKFPTFKVFLLSAKAGGVGLNLVGASRLVLYDNDWNPLVDLQAMARIHRDGQTKPVFIYRLFTTGAIDEKIFQRQLMKNNLSDMFLDDKTESTLNVFDYEDLKDLFTIADTNCNTHDLLDCECLGVGDDMLLSQEGSSEAEETIEDLELPSSGFMSASEYKDLDGSVAAKKQSIRSALTSYRHFDPKMFKADMDMGDTILSTLVLNPKTKDLISYVLTHISSESRDTS